MNTLGLKKLPNGQGGFGRCYIIDNDTLYKKFFKLSKNKYPFSAEYFEDLVGLENRTFVFPKELEIRGDYTTGYTMDYIHAGSIESKSFDCSITDFIISLDDLREDIYELDDQGIIIRDVTAEHILYDGDFHIIDTDLYIKDKNNYYDSGYNEDYLVSYLYSFFSGQKSGVGFESLIEKSDELRYADSEVKKNCTISNLKEFLYEMKGVISKLEGEDIDDFQNLYKGISRVR